MPHGSIGSTPCRGRSVAARPHGVDRFGSAVGRILTEAAVVGLIAPCKRAIDIECCAVHGSLSHAGDETHGARIGQGDGVQLGAVLTRPQDRLTRRRFSAKTPEARYVDTAGAYALCSVVDTPVGPDRQPALGQLRGDVDAFERRSHENHHSPVGGVDLAAVIEQLRQHVGDAREREAWIPVVAGQDQDVAAADVGRATKPPPAGLTAPA